MTLRRFALASKPSARTGAVLALLALTGVGIGSANTDAVVAERFTAALEAAPQQIATAEAAIHTLVSGSEAFWLAEKRRHETDGAALEPAAWSPPLAAGLAIGDRITISTGKSERVLQVVAISDVEPGTMPASATAGGTRHVAVTCRELGAPDGKLTTFLAPADTGHAQKSARAL